MHTDTHLLYTFTMLFVQFKTNIKQTIQTYSRQTRSRLTWKYFTTNTSRSQTRNRCNTTQTTPVGVKHKIVALSPICHQSKPTKKQLQYHQSATSLSQPRKNYNCAYLPLVGAFLAFLTYTSVEKERETLDKRFTLHLHLCIYQTLLSKATSKRELYKSA